MGTRYLLDTSICIYIAKYNPRAVRERFARHGIQELAMSVVTLGELRFGAEKSQARERSLAVVSQLERTVRVCALPEAAGEHYGQIRALLQQQDTPIGNNDLWLAAHALCEGWLLVTSNERGFARVPGLQVENWVAAP